MCDICNCHVCSTCSCDDTCITCLQEKLYKINEKKKEK